jgi:hypothetical protein
MYIIYLMDLSDEDKEKVGKGIGGTFTGVRGLGGLQEVGNFGSGDIQGLKGRAFAPVLEVGLSLAMTGALGGEFKGDEIAMTAGGAVMAELIEYGVEKTAREIAESATKKVSSKALMAATKLATREAGQKLATRTASAVATQVGKSAVKTGVMAARMSAAAAKAASIVGIAFAVFDVVNMSLDIADVCDYNKKEITQSMMDTTYVTVMNAYREAYAGAGLTFPFEVKPEFKSEEDINELNKLMATYLNDCNLVFDEKIDDYARKKRMKRQQRLMNVYTGDETLYYQLPPEDNTRNTLLLILAYNKQKQRQQEQRRQPKNVPFYEDIRFIIPATVVFLALAMFLI